MIPHYVSFLFVSVQAPDSRSNTGQQRGLFVAAPSQAGRDRTPNIHSNENKEHHLCPSYEGLTSLWKDTITFHFLHSTIRSAFGFTIRPWMIRAGSDGLRS
jgi:hypothetical protein